MARASTRFGRALHALRSALGLSQDELGARLGVTRRTLTRWEVYDELPPLAMRKHIATSFPDAPAELRDALVQTLGLAEDFVTMIAYRPAPADASSPAPELLDPAFLELCEAADVAPGRLRPALVAFLRRAEASGCSTELTCKALERRASKASPAGRKR